MRKDKKGFTLMEVIVATGIFAIVSVMVAQLFLSASRAQQRAGVSQKIQSDARLIMSQLADRMRYGTIDYAAYTTPITSPVEELHLIDEHGVEIFVRKGTTVCPDANSSPCLEISEDGGAFFPMSSRNFTVNVVQFFIDPDTNPDPGGSVQPRLTFVLGIQSSERDSEVGTTYIQTTVSSRDYF